MKPKQLQWDALNQAFTAIGVYRIGSTGSNVSSASLVNKNQLGGVNRQTICFGRASIEEARAGCQAHFDQLWRDMTDQEPAKMATPEPHSNTYTCCPECGCRDCNGECMGDGLMGG